MLYNVCKCIFDILDPIYKTLSQELFKECFSVYTDKTKFDILETVLD